MKKNMTLALGSLMFVLTLAAAPHRADAASSSTPTATTAVKGESTDSAHKDWIDIVVTVMSLLPL